MKPGERLGPYEILAPIGKGGMGEVWKARDTRLGRDVAIKISTEQFSERFEREARAVAALNHPNICTLHDVGPNYLVMEYIEGLTLAERIKEGPIPLEEALGIARHVADALDVAHEKNIIHRDLKPGNIKIKHDGTVKVLDFGLAKMGGTPTAKPEDSPTLSMAATQAGMILGTAAYMSPEQARGKEVDKRADIWAFGVVLYEMLTGKQLFAGETVSDVLAGVLRHEPDWEQVPAQVRRLLRKCLAKDPAKRLRDIGDVWELLDEASPTLLAPSQTQSTPRLGWIAAGIAILIAGALGFGWWRASRRIEQPLKPLVRLDVDLGPDVSLSSSLLTTPTVILSPDGTRLAYVSQNRLFTRRLDQSKATELIGTDGAVSPFFSPDGQWVAFFSNGKLRKISVEGGSAIALCDFTNSRGGTWGEDGNIIAARGGGGLLRIPSVGGSPVLVSAAEGSPRWPQVLPGGKAVLFTSLTDQSDQANIEVMSLATRDQKTLVRGGTFGRYVASGHLVYVNSGTLFAVPFDLDTLVVRGAPVPVLDQVAYSQVYGAAQIDVSWNGALVYRNGGVGNGRRVTVQWLDGSGKSEPLLTKPGDYSRPHFSPDGQRLALEVREGSSFDTWVYDWRRDTLTRLTFGAGGLALNPVWSPDGRFIIFGGNEALFWTRSDGAGMHQPLVQTKNISAPFSFTPDGKRLAWNQAGDGGYDLWTATISYDSGGLRAGTPEPFLKTSFDERTPVFSPDGRWVAYTSNESGIYQVYVRAFPDRGGKWQISNEGGAYPVWARNAPEFFFRSPDNHIMMATYTSTADSFVADKPKVWSEKHIADFGTIGTNTYDVAPDGKRIAALMPIEGPAAQQAISHVIFLLNFSDELRRRAPITK